jgi:tetratricopeptide (TPR) repeat protein
VNTINSRWSSRRGTWRIAAAMPLILFFAPHIAGAESITGSVKTWLEIRAANRAAEALGNRNISKKERLRIEQIYYQLVRDNPQSAAAHNALAVFLWNSGKPDGAIEHWRTAQRLQPDNGEAADSLGGAYLRMGRVREAAAQFSLAIRCDNGNADYHFDLANVEFVFRHDLAAAWKMDSAELARRALSEYREASRLAPTDRKLAGAYAETFYVMPNPDWKEAQVAWQRYLELSTNRSFAYLQLARVSLKQRNKAEALSFLDKIPEPSFSGVKEKLRKQADAL